MYSTHKRQNNERQVPPANRPGHRLITKWKSVWNSKIIRNYSGCCDTMKAQSSCLSYDSTLD